MKRLGLLVCVCLAGCFPDWHSLNENVEESVDRAADGSGGGSGGGDGDGSGGGDGDGSGGGDGDGNGGGDGDGSGGGDGDGDGDGWSNGDGDGDAPFNSCGSCPPPAGPGGLLQECCTTYDDVASEAAAYENACGVTGYDLVLPSLEGTCVEYGRAGEYDPDCPLVQTMAGDFEGCCLDNGTCGALDTLTGNGCIGGVHGPGAYYCNSNMPPDPVCQAPPAIDCNGYVCSVDDVQGEQCAAPCCADTGGCGVVYPDDGVCEPTGPVVDPGCPAGYACAPVFNMDACADPDGNLPPCDSNADCPPGIACTATPFMPEAGCAIQC